MFTALSALLRLPRLESDGSLLSRLRDMKRNTKKYERFLINSEAVRSAHIPISHAHIQYGRLLTYYWYISKTSHIPEFPINRKRE